MFDYDYEEAIKDDIRMYIEDNVCLNDYEDYDDLEESLNEALFINDSVTGNGSGSYTFSTYEAEENLCHNWDLLLEALEDFGETDLNILEKGAEFCDVTIRCYLLPRMISEIIEDLKAEGVFEEVKNE